MLLRASLIVALVVGPLSTRADTVPRTIVLRERATASLLDGAFTFELLKIRGYSVDVRIHGKRRLLKIGQSFSPAGSACSVTFKKISPETRIARFVTDCSRDRGT